MQLGAREQPNRGSGGPQSQELGSNATRSSGASRRHSGATQLEFGGNVAGLGSEAGRSAASNPASDPPTARCRRGRTMRSAIEVLDVIEALEKG
eukprot:7624817-Alexandrium_andersonii.AAC.1